MDAKELLYAIAAFILYLIFAIVYFIILGFVIKLGINAIGASGDVTSDAVAIAAAVLTAGTIIAGGGISKKFE